MFVRTSSLIEFQLEEAVRELQRDEYLGDAAWPVVWRLVDGIYVLHELDR